MKIFNDLYAFLWMNPTANNCNTYFIDGAKRILIDPGHYHLMHHVQEGLTGISIALEDIDLVIITHAHPDHMEGIKAFSKSSALIAVGKDEMDFLQGIDPQYGNNLGMADTKIDIFLQEGDLHVGNYHFRIIPSPGHSPGSICLYWPDRKALFTGDVVFNQGVGRTDLTGGDGQMLKKSIIELSRLDVDFLLPGHGDMITTPENVRRNFQDIERMWFGYL